MWQIIQSFDFNWFRWILLILSAFVVGFSKTGINGMTMLVIPILAMEFGGKDSSGIMLPMLLSGDLFAIWYYRKSVKWRNVMTPLPWAVVGILLGAVVGSYISDKVFLNLIGIIVLLCLGILVYMERKGKDFSVPKSPVFYILIGIISGFGSMIGNAAGPIFSVYLLALGFKKNTYMGTNAWFFFIVNFLKLPLQIILWNNISMRNVGLTFFMIPFITLGALLGFVVLKRVNEKFFRYLIITMTTIAALRLFL